MGKRSLCESERNSLTIDVLVTQTEHNLSQIGFRTLWFSSNHFENIIQIGWNFLWYNFLETSQTTVQLTVNVKVKWIDNLFTSLMESFFFNNLFISVKVEWLEIFFHDILMILLNFLLKLPWKHNIGSTDCETVLNEPLINYSLRSCHEFIGCIRSDLKPDWVDKTTCARSDDFFL